MKTAGKDLHEQKRKIRDRIISFIDSVIIKFIFTIFMVLFLVFISKWHYRDDVGGNGESHTGIHKVSTDADVSETAH